MANPLPPNATPVQKVVQKIGDGKHTSFTVKHPLAPDVIVNVYSAKTGVHIPNVTLITSKGEVWIGVGHTLSEDEYTVVVVG